MAYQLSEADLEAIRREVREQRAEQGLPPVIEDPETLRTIARLLTAGENKNTSKNRRVGGGGSQVA